MHASDAEFGELFSQTANAGRQARKHPESEPAVGEEEQAAGASPSRGDSVLVHDVFVSLM
jgi:hypothetical protein